MSFLQTKEIAIQRSRYTENIRNFFKNKDFIEVETPILSPIPGMEPYLTPFETTLKTPLNTAHKLYMNHSPELQMKKLLGGGFEQIFTITKVFRNGEIGGDTHNPEFTMLEWYRKNATYKDIMQDTEDLIKTITNKNNLAYQGHTIDLSKPFEQISINQLFLKHCNIDLLKNKTFKQFKKTADEKNYDTNACESWDDIFFKIFLNHIEKNLGFDRPTIVYDYPKSQAALAQIKKENNFFAERFELYIAGIELANAFSELIDPEEQRKRLKKEQKTRKKLKKTVFNIDEDFLSALKSISEPTAGIALGIDRLLMILLDKKSIDEVILFPLNKTVKWQQQQT